MKIFGGVALVLTTMVLAACGGSSDSSDSSSTPATDGSQDQAAKQDQQPAGDKAGGAQGEEIFTANCGSCHTLAAAGASGTSGPDLDTLKPNEATVKKQVENGGAVMPAFAGTLSAEEISSVSKYVADNAGQ